MNEVWKVIESASGYSVSSLGRIRNDQTGLVMKERRNPEGYCFAALRSLGRRRDVSVHRLVAAAFIDNPEDKPCVNHIDGNKSNNSVNNLEWCTKSENSKHSFAVGLQSTVGELHPRAKLGEAKVRVMRRCAELGLRNIDIASWFGVNPITASAAIHGRNWGHVSHGGPLA